MSISLLRVEVRGPRRLRAIFTNTLAAAAFTNMALYTLTSTNSLGASPNVLYAFAITGMPEAVELAFDTDLVSGGAYSFTGNAVPCTDLSTFTGSSPFWYRNDAAEIVNKDAVTWSADRQAFGIDMVWAGDYLEDGDGDLATAEGIDVAMADLGHAMEDEGLPWDPTWGAFLNSAVDAPLAAQVSYRARVLAQVRRDDRVLTATVVASADPAIPDQVVFSVTPTFRGNRQGKEISYAVVP